MNATGHRVTCAPCGTDGRVKIWRENCADCATERAERHRAETGHPVELTITTERTWEDLRNMTGLAHPVLLGQRRWGRP